MTMNKVLHPRDDIDKLNVQDKMEENSLAVRMA